MAAVLFFILTIAGAPPHAMQAEFRSPEVCADVRDWMRAEYGDAIRAECFEEPAQQPAQAPPLALPSIPQRRAS